MRPLRGLLALALLLGGVALATTYRVLELAEMLRLAEVAFVGTVASTEVELRQGQPWTVVDFEVERWLHDPDLSEGSLELAFLGGEASGGPALQVHLMPRFEVGERVVILAYEDPYYSPIVGFRQGLWRWRDGRLLDESGRQLALDQSGALVLDGSGGDPEAVLAALAAGLEAP